MRFARIVFAGAGIYGLLVLPPHYFLEQQIGRDHPPDITHPEFFYGFIGVAIAFQFVFLILARDPLRFRPMMIPSVIEKATFGVAAIALYAGHRLPAMVLAFGLIDLTLGTLFVAAFLATRPRPA